MTDELPEGTVTILFTDVVGSTELTNRLGDEAARDVLGACDELVRRQVARHRGHEVKGTGDGLMVAFTSARRAIACAVDIQRATADRARREPVRAVGVRIGLNTGEVIREEADLFGATVNAAERIAGHASAGEILASDTVRGLLGATAVELEDRGEVELKGFPEPWRLYAVRWEEKPAGPVLAERTPFVGREDERAQLRRLLDQAARGQGALVMVGGEPGVGKTRLAEELADEARERGFLTLIGHCYEMEGAPPYIPIVEILETSARVVPPEVLRQALGDAAPEVAKLMPELRRLFPDIGPALELPPEQERHYLFNSVREFVARASGAQPLLLVLEDLHWGDDATLLLIQHIAQQLSQMPVLIVGTYRDVELDVARPLAQALEALLRQRLAHRMSLKRLPEAEVQAMLRALSGQEPPAALSRVVYGETEGNPFFVEEVFQHLAEERKLFDDSGRWRSDLEVSELDVPESVRLVIGRRLQRAGEECRRALTAAAVIGRVFSFELLEALGDVDADALLDAIDDAEGAQLIAATADGREARFTFAHELIRQTLMSGLSLPRRQRLHLRVAEAMERVYARAPEEHAADLAHHLYQAGAAADPQKAARYSRLAAERAGAMYAYEEAIRHYERVLTLMGDVGEDLGQDELALLRGLATAQRSVYLGTDAFRTFRRAMRLAQQRGDGQATAELALDQQSITYIGFVPPNLQLELLTLAIESVPDQESELAAVAHARLARMASGEEHKARAEELVEKHGYKEAELFLVAGEFGAANLARRFDALPALTDRLTRLEAEVGRAYLLAYSGWPLQVGDLDLASRYARELLEKARKTSNSGAIVGEYRTLLTVHYARGEFDEYAQLLELYEQESRGPDARLEAAKALLADARGDLKEARERLNAGIEIARQIQTAVNEALMAAYLASVERRLGDENRAEAAYRLALERTSGGSAPAIAAELALEAAQRGDSEVIARFRRELEPHQELVAVYLEVWPGATVVERVLGAIAAAEERWDDAVGHLERAEAFCVGKGLLVELAHSRLALAETLINRDAPGDPSTGSARDRDKARELLTEAVAMYREIGMPKHAELAEARLGEV